MGMAAAADGIDGPACARHDHGRTEKLMNDTSDVGSDESFADPSEVSEVIWPQPGMSIHAESGVREAVAYVNFGDVWHGYSTGFRRAGLTLVAALVETNRDQDYLVYPVIYCFRHHIELQLKSLIMRVSLLLGSDEDLRATHRLSVLWNLCRPLIERALGPDPALDAAASLINEIDALDPNGETFRYPIDTKGAPTLPESVRQIDLLSFARGAEAVAALLEAAESAADAALDDKAEVAALREEMRQEMAWYYDEVDHSVGAAEQ